MRSARRPVHGWIMPRTPSQRVLRGRLDVLSGTRPDGKHRNSLRARFLSHIHPAGMERGYQRTRPTPRCVVRVGKDMRRSLIWRAGVRGAYGAPYLRCVALTVAGQRRSPWIFLDDGRHSPIRRRASASLVSPTEPLPLCYPASSPSALKSLPDRVANFKIKQGRSAEDPYVCSGFVQLPCLRSSRQAPCTSSPRTRVLLMSVLTA